MLFEVMEHMARAVTTSAPGEVVAKRPVFGPTRVSILQRVNKRCTTGGGTDIAQKQEEVVKALVQWGTVREGQVLEAVLPTPIVTPTPRRRADVLPQPTTSVATFTVLSIQRFETPRCKETPGLSTMSPHGTTRRPEC
jgi:hypothetical protein